MPRSTLQPPTSEAPTQIIKPGPSPIPAMYFFAVMFPIVGVILAVRRFYKQDLGNGFGLLVTSIMTSALLWALLVSTASAEVQRPAKPPLPSPIPRIVQMTDDDPMASEVAGYYDGQVIHVADLRYKFGIRHELGHVYDEQYLDAGERQRFATLQAEIYDGQHRLVGHDGTEDTPWFTIAENPDGTVTTQYGDIGEIFADAYAACRSGYVRASGHLWETAYGYNPDAKQHRAICKFIAKAALDPGTSLSDDGWR